jgi:hypothetical protein
MRATFLWREKAFESCVAAKTVKSRGLRNPFRYFGLVRRVPFPSVTNNFAQVTCDKERMNAPNRDSYLLWPDAWRAGQRTGCENELYARN